MKKVKQISIDILVDEFSDGCALAEIVARDLESQGNTVLGSAFQADITQEYKLDHFQLLKDGFRTIKITAGMTQEFEIISTNAPDNVIKTQLMYISTCEEEGKTVPENPYEIIEKFGYSVNCLGCQDDFDSDTLKNVVIDAEFDYYDLNKIIKTTNTFESIIDLEVIKRYERETGKQWRQDVEERMAIICSYYGYGFAWNEKGNIVINNGYDEDRYSEFYKFWGKNFEVIIQNDILKHYEYESAEAMIEEWAEICKKHNTERERKGFKKIFKWL